MCAWSLRMPPWLSNSSDDHTAELVGGATSEGRESCQIFLGVALSQLATPSVDLHTKPRFEVAEYEGETLVLGFREQNGVEGLNEIMRLEEAEGVVGTIRCYCFTPETLDLVAARLGVRANERTYPTGHSRLKS